LRDYFGDTARSLPYVVEAAAEDGAPSCELLCAWVRNHQEPIDERLRRHGAILFRGWNVNVPAAFKRFVGSVAGGLMDYVDGNSPRTKLTGGVYTSTEYPAQYFISLHNELSYSHRWPGRLFFGCIVAPEAQGETVIADSRAILAALPGELVEEFEAKQIRYVRNLHGGDGFGPSWQDTFEASDRDTVEGYCRDAGMACEWKPNGGLRVSQVRPATLAHPRTGERVWFNQADQFHPSTHPPEVYESLMAVYKNDEEELPQNVRFGDGTPIDRTLLDLVRETTRQQTVYFPWQQGDVMMVDNMLVAHGRAPFSGPRKILVSMCDPQGGSA
jgi:alpha-ketoglutarate-dependent taurine dioxygenase